MSTKRLIETAFPLAEASAASLHEKNMRHGHISTLHLWPARRPLAASRAAIAAALLPDPGDDERRAQLVRRLGGKLVPKKKTKAEEGAQVEKEKVTAEGGILWWGQQSGPKVAEFREAIREANGGRPPRLLDPFAGGGAIPLEAMRLGCEVTANDLNPVAWFILKCTLEYPQLLAGERRPLPDFALKDAVFMEAFLKAHGVKPGTQMRQQIALAAGVADAPKRLLELEDHAWMKADLGWHVRAWGQWLVRQLRIDLADRYPTYAEWTALDPKTPIEARPIRLLRPGADGRVSTQDLNRDIPEDELRNPETPRWVAKPTVAYLWARTVRCKACRATVPLLKTRWLSRKKGKRVRLAMEPNPARDGVIFAVESAVPVRGATAAARKAADKELAGGTMSRTGVKCPCCSGLMSMEDVRYEASEGRTGAVMTAVVCDGPRHREYRDPTDLERQAAMVSREELDELFRGVPFGIPDEPISPIRPSPNTRGASGLTRYGIDNWGKLFTDRQLLLLGHLCRAVRGIGAPLAEAGYPEPWRKAIASYLALANDRCADYGSVLCSWANSGEFVRGTFVRFVLSIIWDYAEVNPLSASTGGYASALEWVAKAVSHSCEGLKDALPPRILHSSATEIGGEFDAIVTDPPYYDAIPYSDLMDFFHVWMRRTVHDLDAEHSEVFRSPLGPKWDRQSADGELVDQPGRFDTDGDASRQAYEEGMARVFRACHDSLVGGGPMVLVFANKQPLAWAALVASLIKSGFVVDASWPIKTERGARTNAISTASLSSSVWLVCRKRPPARPGFSGRVLENMRENIRSQMHRFWDAGIRGPDFVWAATGPALEAYSRHPVVFRESSTSGEKERMPVDEFLREVRRLVVEFAVGRVLKMAEGGDAEDTAVLDDVTTYYVLHRDSFGSEDAPIGACILYALSCGISDTDLTDRYAILTRSGGAAADAEGEDDDEEAEEEEEATEDADAGSGSGSAVRLRRWDQRTRRNLGIDGYGSQPPPMIDRVHRVMQLWKEGDQAKVNAFLSQTGVVRDPLFAHLVQALIELARRERRTEEQGYLESISNHLQARSGITAVAQASLAL